MDAILDTARMRIGEQANIDIYLSYSANKNLKVIWPSIGDTLTEKVEVISVSPIDTTFPDKSNSTKILQHQRVTISVYDSGYFAVPGFKFFVNDDTTRPLFTKPLFLEVHTVPTDTSATKIKDIKPPFNEPFNWRWYVNYLYAGLAILALLVITVLITRYYSRKHNALAIEPPKPKLPAHIMALAALEKIREESVWKDGKIKEYYSAISDTIRFYIEDRFALNALESTTDEIMIAFRTQVVDKESKDKLQQLLTLSDLVKFAKQFPIEVEHHFTLQNAFDFVNGTKREEEYDASAFDDLQKNSPLPYQRNESQQPTAAANQSTLTKKKVTALSNFQPKEPKHFWLYILAGILLVMLFFYLTFTLSSKIMQNAGAKMDAPGMSGQPVNSIEEVAEQLNALCPVMIDQQIRLDRAEAAADNTLVTYLTLLGVQAGQIDAEAFKNQMRPALLQQINNNPQFRPVLETSGSLQCIYSDQTGSKICEINIGPADYLN